MIVYVVLFFVVLVIGGFYVECLSCFGVVLVLMVGYSDVLMCQFVVEQGVLWMVSEMISVCGLVLGSEQELFSLGCFYFGEQGWVVQFFGVDFDVFVDVVGKVEVWFVFVVIDFNFGCLVFKVCGKGGVCFLQIFEVVYEFVWVMWQVIGFDVSVKICFGWDENCSVEIVQGFEVVGVVVVMVYGCISVQCYIGNVDWDVIGWVVQVVWILVIGSGDVLSLVQVCEWMQQSGVVVVMIGCGVVGNFWMFWVIVSGEEMLFFVQECVCIVLWYVELQYDFYIMLYCCDFLWLYVVSMCLLCKVLFKYLFDQFDLYLVLYQVEILDDVWVVFVFLLVELLCS